MKLVAFIILVSASIVCEASAQALSLQLRDGDVYFQDAAGVHRLTSDGRNSDAAMSRDGNLIAYVRKDGQNADSEDLNSLHVCNLPAHACQEIVSPHVGKTPQENLTGIRSPQFSYQASIGAAGVPIGSVFFETDAWATSGAIHRVTLGANPMVTFVTDSNGFSVVPSGRFAGALEVSQHRYLPQGGSCEKASVIDPNTGKQLQLLPTTEC
jgi:hypothetical protein